MVTMPQPVLAILVGGSSSRMGGRPKGLLDAGSGESIVARLVRIGRTIGLEVVLSGSLPDYDALGVRRIEDGAPGSGPSNGLLSVMEAMPGRDVVLVACDMPRVSQELVARLASLPEGTTAAPKVDETWQPTLARYAASVRHEATQRLSRGERSLFGLLDAVGALPLSLDEREESGLLDWDTPEDVSGR